MDRQSSMETNPQVDPESSLDVMLDFEIEELESRVTFSNNSDGSTLIAGDVGCGACTCSWPH